MAGHCGLWRSDRHLVEFAYRQPDHWLVLDRTPTQGWYGEEQYAPSRWTGVDGDRRLIRWE
jgi:hypothetical protein